MSSEEEITITPQSTKHAKFILLAGSILLCCCLLLNVFFWVNYKIQLMFMLFTSLIVLFIGILKTTEPKISYRLTRKNLYFNHRNGTWHQEWSDIIKIGEIFTTSERGTLQLPYLGIKLTGLESIAENISPRLANKLLHEQKELYRLAIINNLITGDKSIICFAPIVVNNKTYKGPVAAWLYRTIQLNTAFGYHLYLSEGTFDRNSNEFLVLLNNCKRFST